MAVPIVLVRDNLNTHVSRRMHARVHDGGVVDRGFGSAWGEEAELVAFRVGEDRPRDIAF
ncbi:hypothetical protein GCM10027259_40980 [Micromonospora palomenae]